MMPLACRLNNLMNHPPHMPFARLSAVVRRSLADDRLYVNDKKAPENRKDLDAIQSALIKALPKARAATVCIEIDEGSGTGVIVSADGLVLTAAHVSTGVGKKVTMILEDGTKLKAKTLGLVSDTDAAMIQITDEGTVSIRGDRPQGLRPPRRLGVRARPLRRLRQGPRLVVRLGRLVRMANSTFQSDCILIGGDSGGPLFDLSGRLSASTRASAQGLQENLHVPMSEFITHWDAHAEERVHRRGTLRQEARQRQRISRPRHRCPAGGRSDSHQGRQEEPRRRTAGLKEGDVILKLNDTPLANREDLQDLLKEMSAGDEVTFELDPRRQKRNPHPQSRCTLTGSAHLAVCAARLPRMGPAKPGIRLPQHRQRGGRRLREPSAPCSRHPAP